MFKYNYQIRPLFIVLCYADLISIDSHLFIWTHCRGQFWTVRRKKSWTPPRKVQDQVAERERERSPFSRPCFPPCLSHPLFSLPFSLLFFLVVSLFFSLYISFYPLLSFCFSLFAARRCVWSVVAAARVDSLITLSGPSGPLPTAPPPRSRPFPVAVPPREKGKKVPKIQGPSLQIVFYECLHVPVGPKTSTHSALLPCERHSSSAITFGNLLQDKRNSFSLETLSFPHTECVHSKSAKSLPDIPRWENDRHNDPLTDYNQLCKLQLYKFRIVRY